MRNEKKIKINYKFFPKESIFQTLAEAIQKGKLAYFGKIFLGI